MAPKTDEWLTRTGSQAERRWFELLRDVQTHDPELALQLHDVAVALVEEMEHLAVDLHARQIALAMGDYRHFQADLREELDPDGGGELVYQRVRQMSDAEGHERHMPPAFLRVAIPDHQVRWPSLEPAEVTLERQAAGR